MWREVIKNTGLIIAIGQLGQNKKFIGLHCCTLNSVLNKEHCGVSYLSQIPDKMYLAYTLKSGLGFPLHSLFTQLYKLNFVLQTPITFCPIWALEINRDNITGLNLYPAQVSVSKHPIFQGKDNWTELCKVAFFLPHSAFCYTWAIPF